MCGFSMLSRLFRTRIRRHRNGYHFSVFRAGGAGEARRDIHFLVLMWMSLGRVRLLIRVWDGLRLGLILRKINGVRVCNIARHGLCHVNFIWAWKPLYNSVGEKRNLTFRPTIYGVALIEYIEDQSYPSRIGHVVGASGTGDEMNEVVEE